MVKESVSIIPVERIQQRIYLIRSHKVMLSHDLAALYGVEPRALVQAVKRNMERFPPDFMFQLNQQEFDSLKSQIVTSSWGGMRRAHPYAFTEQGVAMLSSVLRSNRAVQVNIAIMRTFVKLREILTNNALLREKIESLERKYDGQFEKVFSIINLMLEEKARPKAPIGYLSEARGRRKRAKKAGTRR